MNNFRICRGIVREIMRGLREGDRLAAWSASMDLELLWGLNRAERIYAKIARRFGVEASEPAKAPKPLGLLVNVQG